MMSGKAWAEWKRFGYLPLVAAIGYATSIIQVFSLGPFFAPIQAEFDWSRAQVSLGVSIASFISSACCIPVGMAVDRYGPRPIALTGVLLITAAYALLGTATGTMWNWVLLWVIVAIGTLGVQTTVWTSAVASRFEASRGLALAITLSGASAAAAVFPLIASALIERYGWRMAFFSFGGFWAALVFPIVLLGFRGARDGRRGEDAPVLHGISFAEGLRMPALYKLLLASCLITFTVLGMLVHYVPILTDAGTEPVAAAAIAALIGVFSVIGRIATGFLLDHLPGHLLGAAACVFPVIASVALLFGGSDPTSQSIAAACIGLTLGSEVDVVAYLASRHFGLRSFGALYGALVMALGMGTAFGPLAAGAVFDSFGSYREFLIGGAVLMSIASISMLSLGRPPLQTHTGGGH